MMVGPFSGTRARGSYRMCHSWLDGFMQSAIVMSLIATQRPLQPGKAMPGRLGFANHARAFDVALRARLGGIEHPPEIGAGIEKSGFLFDRFLAHERQISDKMIEGRDRE